MGGGKEATEPPRKISLEVPTEAPPAYEDSTTGSNRAAPASAPAPSAHAQSHATTSSAKPEPEPTSAPDGAQRAHVPLRIEQSNQSLRENYRILHKPDAKPARDVFLKTSNGKLVCGVWVDGLWDRVFSVEAVTSNGKVEVSVEVEKGQEVDLEARSSNGKF